MAFKEMLKYYRKKSGMSQAELAKKLDISPSTIGMYEQGRREPDFETEEKIADLFNVNIETLRGIARREEIELDEFSKRVSEIMSQVEQETKKQILGYAEALYDTEKRKGGEEI